MRKEDFTSGNIFCIPLSLPKDNCELSAKLQKSYSDNFFAFGRIIETTSDVTIEVFNKIGPISTPIEEIIQSGIMISPVKVFGDGIHKKRWKIISRNPNYDKYRDSNYANLEMVYGIPDEFRLRRLSTKEEIPISREEMLRRNIPYAIVWHPTQFERRILELISNKNSI